MPVSIYIPNITTGRNNSLTVPIDVTGLNDPVSVLQQSGLSGGTFVLFYNPTVFTVSASDVQLGTISSPSVEPSLPTPPG